MPGRVARRLLPLLVAPFIAACSWLLDFDELKSGEPTGGAGTSGTGAGGSSNAGRGGTAGSEGGAGGSSDCAEPCDDGDPCTVDTCVNGECTKVPAVGLVPDGVDETIPADQHFRVTMAPASDAFFLSSFAANDSRPEVTLYRLGATGDAFEPVATLGGLNLTNGGDPRSAAGMSVDDFGSIHAFVAMGDRTGTATRVWHIVLDMSYEAQLRTPIGDNYWADSPYNYPVALGRGSQTYAAWINVDHTISLSDGMLVSNRTLSADTAAETVSLLTSANDDPAVLYAVAGGGVFVEQPGRAPMPIEECQPAPGDYLSSSVTFTSIPGFWLASWTKFAEGANGEEGYLTSDLRGLGCSPAGCVIDQPNCGAASANNLVRNPAGALAMRPGDRTGLVYLAQAGPFVGVDEQGMPFTALTLGLARVDLGTVPFQSQAMSEPIGETLLVAGGPAVAPDFRGPDWPVLGFVPPNHFALAWIQPGASGGDELRVRRYAMCTPE